MVVTSIFSITTWFVESEVVAVVLLDDEELPQPHKSMVSDRMINVFMIFLFVGSKFSNLLSIAHFLPTNIFKNAGIYRCNR